MNAKEIRNLIIAALLKNQATVAVNLDGHYFSGVDVIMKDEDGEAESYRIAVVSHEPQR